MTGRSAVIALLFFLPLGCAGSSPEAVDPTSTRPQNGERASADPFATAFDGPLPLAAAQIGSVPEGTYGPYVGDRPEGTLVVWAAGSEDEESPGREWLTAPLKDLGRPGEPRRIATAPVEIDLVAVKPAGRKAARGFAVLATTREFSGERVEALLVGLEGVRHGGPVTLAESLTDVVWVDAVPIDEGALAFWAVRRSDRADLFAAAVSSTAEVISGPREVLRDVRAWQVAAVQKGAAVAAVMAGQSGADAGRVQLVYLDETGEPEKKPIVISDQPTAELDLDMAQIGDGLVLAWSDRRSIEPRIHTAALDGKRKIAKSAGPVTSPLGAQAVLRIVAHRSEGGPAFLAWENLAERPRRGRAFRIAPLSPDGTVGEQSALVGLAADDGSVPELGATAKGIAALTLAPLCPRQGSCDGERVVPTFVQLDKALDVVASEPLRLEPLDGRPVELAWGLTCQHYECLALAARPTTPAPVYAVRLESRTNAWRPAAQRYEPRPPHAAEIATVGTAASVADFAAIPAGDGIVAAWVTRFDPTTPWVTPKTPAPDGRRAPVRAILGVRALSPDGVEASGPSIISYRARSSGGVALSTASATADELLLGWAALENQEPQVFLTVVGRKGQKIRQRMLTRAKSEVSDVAVAALADGWGVVWVDDRDGTPELYGSRVDRRLQSRKAEQRLTRGAGSPTGVVLRPGRGDQLFAAWSDARKSSNGSADIYTALLGGDDLSLAGTEQRVSSSPVHAHSPALASFGEGAVVAWIEEAPDGEEGAATAVLRQLDADAAGAGAPVRLMDAGDARPIAINLACKNGLCRLAVVAHTGERQELYAGVWRPGSPPSLSLIAALGSSARTAPAPQLLGDDLIYLDHAADGEARLRRARMVWP